jgi:hypothetical protein
MKKIFFAQLLFILALVFAKDGFSTAKPTPAIPPVMSDTFILDSDVWVPIVSGVPGNYVQVMDLISPTAFSWDTGLRYAEFQVRDVNGLEKPVFPNLTMSNGIILKYGETLEARRTFQPTPFEIPIFWSAKLHH